MARCMALLCGSPALAPIGHQPGATARGVPYCLHNGRQRGDDDGRDARLLNRSLHNHGRAVARASASRHDHRIHALGAQELRDGRPCDVRQHVDIAPSPHKADVRWCDLFDHTCRS